MTMHGKRVHCYVQRLYVSNSLPYYAWGNVQLSKDKGGLSYTVIIVEGFSSLSVYFTISVSSSMQAMEFKKNAHNLMM